MFVNNYMNYSARWSVCTDALTNYICEEIVSYHTVDKLSFRECTLDLQYESRGRTSSGAPAADTTAVKLHVICVFVVSNELQHAISAAEKFNRLKKSCHYCVFPAAQ